MGAWSPVTKRQSDRRQHVLSDSWDATRMLPWPLWKDFSYPREFAKSNQGRPLSQCTPATFCLLVLSALPVLK